MQPGCPKVEELGYALRQGSHLQLVESAGVATSTVRYYERVGLMTVPARTASGYRDYADEEAARLRFITRAEIAERVDAERRRKPTS